MEERVSLEILFAEEGLIAGGALHGLGAFVDEFDVGGETCTTVESTITVRTGEGVFAGVVEDVGPQLSRLNECLTAELAYVWLLPCVSADMPVECLLRRETVVALNGKTIICVVELFHIELIYLRAFVRPFSGVHSAMFLHSTT